MKSKILLILTLILTTGCWGGIMNFTKPYGPTIYGGVGIDVDNITYETKDGEDNEVGGRLLMCLDLPFCFVFDTVTLPWSIYNAIAD